MESPYQTMCEAMVSGDVAAMAGILSQDFTLTHMTGYVQAKTDWFDAIESGEMTYHGIRTVEFTAKGEDGVPTLTVRTLTDATIWGSRANWRLLLRFWFEPGAGTRVMTRSVAATW